MKRHDKVVFHYGHDIYTGVVRVIAKKQKLVCIKFWPWPVFGEWMPMDGYHAHEVIGRTWWGRYMDRHEQT